MTDNVEEERDRRIADHVLRMHRYLQPGVEEGTPAHDNLSQFLNIDGPATNDPDAEEEESSPFEKYNPLLHIGFSEGSSSSSRRNATKKVEILSVAFIKKYIQYAKSKPSPVLTKGAAEWIISVYAKIRNEELKNDNKRVSKQYISTGLLSNV